MKNCLLITSLILIVSCSEKIIDTSDDPIVKVYSAKDNDEKKALKADSLLKVAVRENNLAAYNDAYNYYWTNDRLDRTLYSSIIMADKYGYDEAYFNVYLILTHSSITDGPPMELNDKTENLAMFYLLRAYELKNHNAFIRVSEIFVNKKIPKSSFYLSEIAKE